jgi:hypothetical protein
MFDEALGNFKLGAQSAPKNYAAEMEKQEDK